MPKPALADLKIIAYPPIMVLPSPPVPECVPQLVPFDNSCLAGGYMERKVTHNRNVAPLVLLDEGLEADEKSCAETSGFF